MTAELPKQVPGIAAVIDSRRGRAGRTRRCAVDPAWRSRRRQWEADRPSGRLAAVCHDHRLRGPVRRRYPDCSPHPREEAPCAGTISTYRDQLIHSRERQMPTNPRPDGEHLLSGVPHTGEATLPDGHLVEPQAADFEHARAAPPEPDWYKRAVFYEVLVRAFADSNGDGTGDLRGLAGKLDYLAWLGVDCLWLPPFYASPLRDGGYDISDFRAVLPEFGTVEDFVYLLDQAHRRGIRVVTDLVLNHTSDAHPWFQESRHHPDGPYGDYYVWSDDDQRYADARVIFVDTESSNWTYDPVRGQFFWHRFFSHQPELNFENEEVQEAMLDVLRFWLDLGIDGFRLDAVPYLFEAEGTNCENLPETHEFLKQCRKVIDDEYPGRVLLAEANQWPADVVEYFGDAASGGDECHM